MSRGTEQQRSGLMAYRRLALIAHYLKLAQPDLLRCLAEAEPHRVPDILKALQTLLVDTPQKLSMLQCRVARYECELTQGQERGAAFPLPYVVWLTDDEVTALGDHALPLPKAVEAAIDGAILETERMF